MGTLSLLSPDSGTSCVSCVSLRRPPERSSPSRRSRRRTLLSSRTSVSGSDMTPDPEPTTCTGSTVTSPLTEPSPSATVIWELGIGPVLTPSRSSDETVAAGKCRRPLVTQTHDSKIKFPLPCRVMKQGGGLVQANRPNTYFQ